MASQSEICAAYRQSLTQAEVARRFNLSQGMVSRILRRNGISARRPAPSHSAETRAKIAASVSRLWAEGVIQPKPRLPFPPGSFQRRVYDKARSIGGASYAREIMGIAA